MKRKTSTMLAHILIGLLLGTFGILTTLNNQGIENPSIIPSTILFPLLALTGILIFSGGLGYATKNKIFFTIGFMGNILLIILALTGKSLPLIIIGALLAFSIYPELKN